MSPQRKRHACQAVTPHSPLGRHHTHQATTPHAHQAATPPEDATPIKRPLHRRRHAIKRPLPTQKTPRPSRGHSPMKSSRPSSGHASLPLPQPLQPPTSCLSMDLRVLDISYRRSPIMCGLLWLAASTEHRDVFQVHLWCSCVIYFTANNSSWFCLDFKRLMALAIKPPALMRTRRA